MTASIQNGSEPVYFKYCTKDELKRLTYEERDIDRSQPFISCYHGYGSSMYLHIPSVRHLGHAGYMGTNPIQFHISVSFIMIL